MPFVLRLFVKDVFVNLSSFYNGICTLYYIYISTSGMCIFCTNLYLYKFVSEENELCHLFATAVMPYYKLVKIKDFVLSE